mgnify:CR=1 FL=1
MAATNKTGIYWIYFVVSLVVTILFLIFWPEWFWVPLPVVLTALVKAFDWL